MDSLKILHSLAMFFVIIGALNWGLIAVFDFNIVTALLGTGTLTKVVYVLTGFFAVYVGYTTYFAK